MLTKDLPEKKAGPGHPQSLISSGRVLESNTHKNCGVAEPVCPDCVACNAFRQVSTVARPLARLVDLDARLSYHEA